ncbi:thioredoxin-like protein [Chytriomyces sp. MP71]|nr:thioredoxin-like protein [Chytriomyces sp. MP71]
MSTDAKIILYTNHGCPWAHRAHIALEELGIPYEEVIIDLSVPRTAEYLAINPRGLVPALSYNGEIIAESAIVVQFLVDAYPSHLVKPADSVAGALERARVSFFVDAYMSKFQGQLYKFYGAKTSEEEEAIVDAAVAALVKEVEPLLTSAKPYFGGSDRLTLAEVLTGSFVIRLVALLKGNVYPHSADFTAQLKEKTPNFYQWANAVANHPSVTSIFNEESIVEKTRERLQKARAAAAAASA